MKFKNIKRCCQNIKQRTEVNGMGAIDLAENEFDFFLYSQCGVLINGFVLSLTSEMIPRNIYKYYYNEETSLKGYIDWSLSVFNVSDFTEQERPQFPGLDFNVTHCR